MSYNEKTKNSTIKYIKEKQVLFLMTIPLIILIKERVDERSNNNQVAQAILRGREENLVK